MSMVHYIVRHCENDVNSLENRASVSDGQAAVTVRDLMKSMYFMLNIFGSTPCSFFVTGATQLFC